MMLKQSSFTERAWKHLKTVPSVVRHAQIWFLMHMAVLVKSEFPPKTVIETCKMVILLTLIALPVIGLQYRKQWARILASVLFILMGAISSFYLVLLVKDEPQIDLVEAFVFCFFALCSIVYIYLGITLWTDRTVHSYFHSANPDFTYSNAVEK
jgi:ABC-type transport system involved in cytochrome c biogenesis permease subunit